MPRPHDYGDQYPSDIDDTPPVNPLGNISESNVREPSKTTIAPLLPKTFDPESQEQQAVTPSRKVYWGSIRNLISEGAVFDTYSVLRQDGELLEARFHRQPSQKLLEPEDSVTVISGQDRQDYLIVGSDSRPDTYKIYAELTQELKPGHTAKGKLHYFDGAWKTESQEVTIIDHHKKVYAPKDDFIQVEILKEQMHDDSVMYGPVGSYGLVRKVDLNQDGGSAGVNGTSDCTFTYIVIDPRTTNNLLTGASPEFQRPANTEMILATYGIAFWDFETEELKLLICDEVPDPREDLEVVTNLTACSGNLQTLSKKHVYFPPGTRLEDVSDEELDCGGVGTGYYAGCGIEIITNTISVKNTDLAGDGLAVQGTCGLKVDADCGLHIVAGVLHHDFVGTAGEGLVGDNTLCKYDIRYGCGLYVNFEDELQVDQTALAGDGLGADTGCALKVNVGCGLEIDEDVVQVKNSDLAGTGLVTEGTCSLAVDLVEDTNDIINSLTDCTLELVASTLKLTLNYDKWKFKRNVAGDIIGLETDGTGSTTCSVATTTC
jgi:hypothetical protein